jgi:ureidoglycolate lyase
LGTLTVTTATGKRVIALEPLTGAAFRGYGDVIDREADDRRGHAINAGTAWRRHDLARVDAAGGGHAAISIVRAEPRPLPFRLQCLERHVLGSQAFVPLDTVRWIVVVAPGRSEPDLGGLRAFLTSSRQGVSYVRSTWHHPLIAIERAADFIVVDRVDDSGRDDCEVRSLGGVDLWIEA